LLQTVAGVINAAGRNSSNESVKSIEFLALFDQGIISRQLDLQNANVENLMLFALRRELSGELVDKTVRFLGSSTSEAVVEMLLDRTKTTRIGVGSQNQLVYWLRPAAPFWGRSSRFEAAVSDFRKAWGEPDIALISPSESGATADDLRHWFGLRPPSEMLFSHGLLMRSNELDAGVEIIIRPGQWVVALIYLRIEGWDSALPIGFYSEEPKVVSDAAAVLAKRFAPLSASSTLLWHPPQKKPAEVLSSLDEQFVAQR
jgi:hypothetical protein